MALSQEELQKAISKYSLNGASTGGNVDIDSIVESRYQEVKQSIVPEKTKLEKTQGIVGKLFAGEKIGEAIGTLFARTKQSEQAKKDFGELPLPSGKEIIGDIGRGALEIAGAKGLGLGKTALSTIGRGAGLGAGFGATGAMKENKDIGSIVSDTVSGATTGAVTAGLFEGAGAVLKGIADKLPRRLVQSAIKQSPKELESGKDLTDWILKNAKFGTTQSLYKESVANAKKYEQVIDKVLDKSTVTVPRNGLFTMFQASDIAQKQQLKPAQILKTITTVAPSTKQLLSKKILTHKEVNTLRKILDKSLGSKAFLTQELSNQKDIARSFSNELRNIVKENAPKSAKIRDVFDEWSKEITLQGNLRSKLAKSRNQLVGVGDVFGTLIGSSVSPEGAIAGVALKRGIESTPFKTGMAITVDRLDKALSPILEQLEPAMQTKIIQAIVDVANQEENK